jgi:ABC-2 type transport system ATP-binding protein
MSDIVIQTHALTRYFGRKCAVDQVTLAVPRGSIFALLGRNGSGKSTFIRMLIGLLEPTRGSAAVLGQNSRHLTPRTRARIGYVAEGHPLIDWMRVSDLESFQKSFYPNWNDRLFKTIVAHFDLRPDSRAGKISRGQRAGLSLALVLATGPELLIIDRSILRVCAPVEVFRAKVRRLTLHFPGQPPQLPAVPGLIEARRDVHSLQLTLANSTPQIDADIASLGATSTTESSLTLEDAVIAYLGVRGERISLLQQTQDAGAPL